MAPHAQNKKFVEAVEKIETDEKDTAAAAETNTSPRELENNAEKMETYAKDNDASKTGEKTPLRCICITYTNSIQIVSLQLLAHPRDLAVLH